MSFLRPLLSELFLKKLRRNKDTVLPEQTQTLTKIKHLLSLP
jgi:hypothetical protein